MKICSKCKGEFDESCFYKEGFRHDGLYPWCKQCKKKSKQIYDIANPGKSKAAFEACAAKNKLSGKTKIDSIAQYEKRKANGKLKAYRAHLNTIPQKKIISNYSTRIYAALKRARTSKSIRTLSLLGCSGEELKVHLETQFTEGMSWDNHTLKGWHIDHIRPCASFDLTDPEQQKLCFHFSNLQPLWALDNILKSDSYVVH
jgi:hypothetical protein